ncbi:hypothetical protein PPTG_02976 [Phytophthora nicotianae INRA-310]|uniref:DDE-1 domain-containing protein n=1 Tax=Phytophthora nicotianae (strain INRA-310) TaxID=761204 RepID=W2R5S1_PHYN3|nr:hypothetical protein PPTG_02976 [Phytophthora nicotianae INRA-310]ETN19840.1 hypothetical protein PPTG_02976 [Phytophthora nicotianae INRA-310]
MVVIPGGLTPYLQAGDVGIYKPFKDNLCKIINEWKHSDQTPDSVVAKSVSICGFSDDPTSWHIARHDVYGTKFRMAWELRSHDGAEDDSGSFDDCESYEHIMETLDDIVIED